MTKKQLLKQAKALGLKPVTRNSTTELQAMIAQATKPKAAKATADENPDVVRLIEAVGTGDLALALEEHDLTPGGLARQLGVEPAVVTKLANGTRVPRTTAAPDSIPGKVGAWFVGTVKTKKRSAKAGR